MNTVLKNIFLSAICFAAFSGFALAEEATTTPADTSSTTPPAIDPAPPAGPASLSAKLNVRYEGSLVFSGVIDFVPGETVQVTPTGGSEKEIPSDSALALLLEADEESAGFALSDLGYYESYDSFIVNCIDIEADAVHACSNWQYVVNDEYPFVGIDDYEVEDGDTIYFYFGSPRRFLVSTTTVAADEGLIVHADSYDYENDGWNALSGATVGATQPNPEDPWNPLVPYTAVTDDAGDARFAISVPGTYAIGLELDYYFPTASIIVGAAVPPAEDPDGGSSGGGSASDKGFDIDAALGFLLSHESGGEIANDLVTDWAAIALAPLPGNEQAKVRMKERLSDDPIGDGWLPDYERRAMALMALGVDPRTGTDFDYISYIESRFDGEQFGESDIFNDDIFAIIPLVNAGYGSSDGMIEKAVAFILSKQSGSGAWIDVDITAAAIQALSEVEDVPGVLEALSQAKEYLRGAQRADGGFGDAFSTAWAAQAIAALGESPSSWEKGGKDPLDYLESVQAADGGLLQDRDIDSRLWATAYAIPAAKGKTWDSILKNFSKPKERTDGSAENGSSRRTDMIAATSTPEVLGAFASDEWTDELREAIMRYIEIVTGMSRYTLIYVGKEV